MTAMSAAGEPLPIVGSEAGRWTYRDRGHHHHRRPGYVQGMAFRPAEAGVIDRDGHGL